MNLKNLLDYGNSIYDFGTKINSLERKNNNAYTKPSTAIKVMMMGFLSGRPSVNRVQQAIFSSRQNKLDGVFAKKEFKPKTHALRDAIDWIYVKFLDTIFRDFLILRPLHI